MSFETKDTARRAQPAKRLLPGNGVRLAAGRRGKRVGCFRPAADEAVNFFLDVDERWFHNTASLNGCNPQSKLAAEKMRQTRKEFNGKTRRREEEIDLSLGKIPALCDKVIPVGIFIMKTMHLVSFAAMVFCFAFTASAQTWTQTSATTNSWSSIASSADGTKLFACAGGNFIFGGKPSLIYASSDGGATWTQTLAPSNSWKCIASSADGTKLVAVAGSLYTSADGGSTWMSNNIAPQGWKSVASSADGSKLFAIAAGQLFITTNSGVIWSSQTIPIGGVASSLIASSADGTKLFGNGGNHVYISTNSGTTWITNNSPSLTLWAVALSADGTVCSVVDGTGGPSGHVFTSTNDGVTWVTNNVPQWSWQNVALSADGAKMIVAGWYSSGSPFGPIYTSTNAGLTWVSNNVPKSAWFGVTCSADGNKMMAVSAGTNSSSIGQGGIWMSQTTSSPQLNLMPSPTNVTVSWVVPSTNFVLQQSSDIANWLDVTNVPVLNLTNLQNQVTLPLSADSSFYRLKTP